VNRAKLLTKEKLEKIFDWFDKDGSKSISHDELKEMLSCGREEKVTEEVWKNLMKEIDQNEDGEVMNFSRISG
jgi:Ca2+-binding EF-hand superfamily protein